MKGWKRQSSRDLRRTETEDVPSGNYYKKLNDVWNSPSDGKMKYGDDPRWTRK